MLACGRRWGKTTLGMTQAVRHALKGERVWWVAPWYHLAADPWRAFKARFAGLWKEKHEGERRIDLWSGGSITIKSADNPDGLRGVGLDFVVIDEAAFIREEVWSDCIRPALADREGSALILSTPAGRNWFHQAYVWGQDPLVEGWQSWQLPSSANPRLRPEEIANARLMTHERKFAQEFLAEFLDDGGAVFRKIRAATTAPRLDGPIPGHRYLMGVDFGRYEDFTALVVVDDTDRTVATVDRFDELEWGIQRERIKALAKRWNVTSILAEANAMGEPNIEALWRDGLPIQAFETTAKTKPGLIEQLVSAIEAGDIRLLDEPVLIAELEAYTYTMEKSGYTRYGAPSGGHDDTVIALALAWKLASTPRLTFAIAEVW